LLLLFCIAVATLYLIIACNYYIMSIVNRFRVLALLLLLSVLDLILDRLLLNSLEPNLEPTTLELELDPNPKPDLKAISLSLRISLVDSNESLSY
jgi:hypothetical protein